MGYVLHPIPDDLFFGHILKVIMKATCDEVIAQLSKLHLVNTKRSRVIKNHPK
jgi:hypothetical protein